MVVCNSYSGNVVIVIIVKGNDRQKEIIEREGKYNQVQGELKNAPGNHEKVSKEVYER